MVNNKLIHSLVFNLFTLLQEMNKTRWLSCLLMHMVLILEHWMRWVTWSLLYLFIIIFIRLAILGWLSQTLLNWLNFFRLVNINQLLLTLRRRRMRWWAVSWHIISIRLKLFLICFTWHLLVFLSCDFQAIKTATVDSDHTSDIPSHSDQQHSEPEVCSIWHYTYCSMFPSSCCNRVLHIECMSKPRVHAHSHLSHWTSFFSWWVSDSLIWATGSHIGEEKNAYMYTLGHIMLNF